MGRGVVVAGAGPAGLMLACELRLAGVDVVVVEPRAEVGTVSQGMALHGRSLELLDRRGLRERVTEEAFVWPRTPFAFLWLDLEGMADANMTYAHPQWRTEKLLEERALELGATIRRGHEVVGLEESEAGVVVEVRSAAGEDRIHAAYLVGCDGVDSAVRELAGIGFPPNGPSYYGLTGDVVLAEGGDGELDVGLHPAGLFGALPLQPGVTRMMTVEFDASPPGRDVEVTVDEMCASVRRITGSDPRIAETHWLSRYGGPVRLADAYRAGRVFLAGDAAHSLFVSGTQGLNAALHDAMNLGWKLAAELNGWAPPGLLDTYHDERHPIGERMCLHARAQIELMHPLERVAPLRVLLGELLQFTSVNRLLIEMPTAAGYPMADEAAHPLLGAPCPVAELTADAGPTTTSRLLRTGRGLLLDLTDATAALPDVTGWKDRVDLVRARPAPALSASVLLIRPDGYVVHADGDAVDHEGLRRALTTWFGAAAA